MPAAKKRSAPKPPKAEAPAPATMVSSVDQLVEDTKQAAPKKTKTTTEDD